MGRLPTLDSMDSVVVGGWTLVGRAGSKTGVVPAGIIQNILKPVVRTMVINPRIVKIIQGDMTGGLMTIGANRTEAIRSLLRRLCFKAAYRLEYADSYRKKFSSGLAANSIDEETGTDFGRSPVAPEPRHGSSLAKLLQHQLSPEFSAPGRPIEYLWRSPKKFLMLTGNTELSATIIDLGSACVAANQFSQGAAVAIGLGYAGRPDFRYR